MIRYYGATGNLWDRVSVVRNADGTVIEVRPHRNYYLVFAASWVLLGWSSTQAAIVRSLMERGPAVWMVVVEAFAVPLGMLIGAVLVMHLFGVEVLKVGSEYVELGRRVGPHSWLSAYPKPRVRVLGVAEQEFAPWNASFRAMGISRGSLAIACGDRVRRFGSNLSPEQASRVAQAMRESWDDTRPT